MPAREDQDRRGAARRGRRRNRRPVARAVAELPDRSSSTVPSRSVPSRSGTDCHDGRISSARLERAREVLDHVARIPRRPFRALEAETGARGGSQNVARSAGLRERWGPKSGVLVWLAVGGAVFAQLLSRHARHESVRLRRDPAHRSTACRCRAPGARRAGSTRRTRPPTRLGDLTRSIHGAATVLASPQRRSTAARAHARRRMNRQLEMARQELDQFFSLSLDLLRHRRRGRPLQTGQRGMGTRARLELEARTDSEPYLDFVHPGRPGGHGRLKPTPWREGRATVGFENRYRARDGSYRWLNWSAVALVERGLIYASGAM